MPDPAFLLMLLGFALMGLHVPKAFTLLYGVLVLLLWSARPIRSPSPRLLLAGVLLAGFGLGYAVISVRFGLWTLGGRDVLDLASMLVLPAGALWVGALAARQLSWRQMGWLWLAYGLGALAFAWLVLLDGRVMVSGGEWIDLLQRRRDSSITVPWGSDPSMNVRSIEQNAALAAAWLLPGGWLLLRPGERRLGVWLGTFGLLALLAVLCFNGRLGFLVALIGVVPVMVAMDLPRRVWRRVLLLLAGLGVAVAVVAAQVPRLGTQLRSRLYDERLDRFAGFLPAAPQFPWGGNQLHFDVVDQQRQVLMQFDARQGELMHNVFFDIYVRVGWLPLLLLALGLVLLLPPALGNLRHALRSPHDQAGGLLLAGVLVCLTVQWLFQPLIFGDGLLFYLGFLLLGCLAARTPEPTPSPTATSR